MADALQKDPVSQQPYKYPHRRFDSIDGKTLVSYYVKPRKVPPPKAHRLSHRLEQRRASCRYFDNHPQTIHNEQVLHNDHFYQEHLKACHFSPCKPLPAPHDDILPDEPPLSAEAPFCSADAWLTRVNLREKLFSPRHIRLVKLFPPGYFEKSKRHNLRSQSRQLRCEAYQASLDDISSDGQPLFAALSYVCGNPAPTRQVRCGKDYIATTQNLFEALLYVRHEDRPRLLWADGLCINQDDVEERNHQVGLLHRIYSQAHVITWLGTGDQTNLKVLSNHLSLMAQMWTSVVRVPEAANLNRLHFRDAAITKYNQICGRQSPFPDVDQIVYAAYFTRVWIAQEMYLGKSGICQLGSQSISVATVIASMELLDHSAAVEQITQEHLMPSLNGTWHTLLGTDSRLQALSIVEGFSKKQCSDPRDHIYGLSALFESPTAYPIDYSLSVSGVFCDFAVHCLKTLEDLLIFSNFRSITESSQTKPPSPGSSAESIVDKDSTLALPSWCPSWPLAKFRIGRIMGIDYQDRWNASGGRNLLLNRPSPLVITLRGCAVSDIIWRSMSLIQSEKPLIIQEAAEYFLSISHHLPLLNSSRIPDVTRLVFSVLENLMMHHESFDYIVNSYESGPNARKFSRPTWNLLSGSERGYALRVLIFPVYLAREFPHLCSMLGLSTDPRISMDDHMYITDLMKGRIFDASKGCCLFTTAGGMLGTSFPGVMVGDVVCVLFGGTVPYILRPTEVEGQYLLVGECYVDELMEGEAMAMGLQEQTFTLV